MNLRELKARVDELCERDPPTAIALARRIEAKLQPDSPIPLAQLHRSLVQQRLQGPMPEQLEQAARLLHDQGWEEAKIQRAIDEMKQPGLRKGQSFGALHIEDVLVYVEMLWRQGTGKFTLQIEFENPDDDHLTLTIVETGKAYWQPEET